MNRGKAQAEGISNETRTSSEPDSGRSTRTIPGWPSSMVVILAPSSRDVFSPGSPRTSMPISIGPEGPWKLAVSRPSVREGTPSAFQPS